MPRHRAKSLVEWVGGRLSPPFFIGEGDESYRAGLALWLELPSGLVVGQEVFAPAKSEGAVGRVLMGALERPLAGPPRRPDSLRVDDRATAAEVRAAVGAAIPVTLAPTPELDALLSQMVESMPEADQSYLAGGRIPPAVVAKLFAAADILYRTAPWKVASEDQVLRMDIPALGVEGACVSIIGALAESLGILVFPSLAGYEAFRRAAEEPFASGGRRDFGTDWLALDFARGADLPASLRREVASHGWPVAAADAYPWAVRHDRDGAARPLVARDLEIAAACAVSLSTFFLKHRRLFEAADFEPVCQSYFDEHDLELRFTLPYEAFALFDVPSTPARKPAPAAPSGRRAGKVGRNAPCPCGSGRKYKKCHLPLDEQGDGAPRADDPLHEIDARLVRELSEFAMTRFGSAWARHVEDFADVMQVLEFALPWSVYHYRVEGVTVLDRYLEEQGGRLSRAEREWLAAQKASWLSVWEVSGVEPGESVTLRDLFSGETRGVREATASRTLVVRDALLARVVDHDGVSLLCGVHPRALAPIEAAEVVRRARARLRRKGAVPPARLRDEGFGRALIRSWETTVADLDARAAIPPELSNTDGDPFLLTTDHFEIAPGARPAVEAQLAALPGVTPPDAGEDPPAYVFLRPGNRTNRSWENTVIGRASFSGQTLRAETNSRERADALRERLEAACGDRLRHRAREHADPLSEAAPLGRREHAPAPLPPEAQQLILEQQQRYYTDWLDEPVPALGGKTPREAARTAQGRSAVDVLLKDMENREQRSKSGAPFDFSTLRRELRVDDGGES